jgi:hypothetical protein
MPFDGSGNFTRSMNWAADAAANIKILASRHDTEDNNFAAGLSLVLCRDGQGGPTADINWNGKKITNLAAPVNGTDAANKTYVDGIRNFSTPIVITGSHPNAQLKYTGSTGPWGESFVTADLAAGVRGTSWVWNDKADFSGNDVMKLDEVGTLTLKGLGYTGLVVNSPAGAFGSYIQGHKAAKPRWVMYLGDGAVESTGNVGSDFSISAYADDGTTVLGGALGIKRDTRLVTASVGLQAGPTAKVSTALISAIGTSGGFAGGNCIEFGHTNPAGYRSTLGVDANGVSSWLIFNGEAGTTAATYRTRGIKAAIFRGDNGGGFQWGNVALVTGDNQAFANLMTLSPAGLLTVADLQVESGTGGSGNAWTATSGYYYGSATGVQIGTSAAGGTILLYPNGMNNTTGRVTITPTNFQADAPIRSNDGFFSGTMGTGTAGSNLTPGITYCSYTGVASAQVNRWYNGNGVVGGVTTSGSTTAFNTTSDENLKEFNADYDPAEAIAIIRADPVLSFTWKVDGHESIGWFAQKSYAVDENLAVPPGENLTESERAAKPGDPDYIPWGIDYGKRTPYLWAALTSVLDRLEAIEAKLGGEPPKPSMKRKAA